MSEVAAGESRPVDWEALHVAATRDGKEHELAGAYNRVSALRYYKDLSPAGQAEVFMHAADYFQGVLGDRELAEEFLLRVLELVPDHAEAFMRLRTRFEQGGDKLRLAELLSTVAEKPPIAADELARQALSAIKLLPGKALLSEPACRRFVAIGRSNLRLLDAVDQHCRKTGRAELSCEIREFALQGQLTKLGRLEQHEALAELYTTAAKHPEKAIDHVETVLGHDPSHAGARAAAEKLLSSRTVASRAAAALREARRAASTRPPPTQT